MAVHSSRSSTAERRTLWWFTVEKVYVSSSIMHALFHEAELPDIAYDIKIIMNKGIIDIIRPEWIKDSVTKGELMPFKKKYVSLYVGV